MTIANQHFVGQAGSLRAGCQPALASPMHTSEGILLCEAQ
jgi:hypothetical protein